MFNVDQVVTEKLPKMNHQSLVSKSVKTILRYLLHEQALVEIERKYPHAKGVDFAETILDHFDFGYCISDKDREKIPANGRVVIIANHPIGTLDGAALIKMVSEIRSDFKVIANDLLMNVKPLRNILLPVNNMAGNTAKQNLDAIYQHLNNEGAVIIFPAGEVSRISPAGIRDGSWHKGFLHFASATNSPILPVYIDARNSALFYAVSSIYKPLSTLFLIKEMFKQAHKRMNIKIGNVIPFEHYDALKIPLASKAKLFKKHLYNIGYNKAEILKTEKAIAHPENRAELRMAINECEQLGKTADGKTILLYRHESSSPIMREIGRLREVSFRLVGEGSGQRRDIDCYDQHYLHLILWDDDDLEIAGAYRFGESQKLIDDPESYGLYTKTLFDYQPHMNAIFAQGLELGRSFVQPKYWGKRSLDYLWVGIGAFVARNPQYRFLFGPVSISNTLPNTAKNLLIHYYQHYFKSEQQLAKAKIPFQLSEVVQEQWLSSFDGNDKEKDFITMKHLLANLGVSVPTLYKQYSALCEDDGVSFSAFNIDPDFNDCVDGLVVVDLDKLLRKKRARYIESHQ
ncbi:lysophospholipid acyltransferase family protein [Colwellia sp. D2M02]|uniref:GNAT family N-acyltransferase n=1 Tax=Colwellia sp. D2M02 TaxID=2841562 RepID=UPI001C09FFC3|nr:lysophospholipid acyltransferase family protein [Colwellia sp. D2M02]MBU2892985.1 lysophospholipid acyltransferase family protein [Colwellia sp. D2M02]